MDKSVTVGDGVKGEPSPAWLRIGKRTKKKTWRNGQSRSWRFSFHKYFTTFFYLFLFFSITFILSVFLHFFYPRHLPTPTTHTTSTRYTTHDPRHLATLKRPLAFIQKGYLHNLCKVSNVISLAATSVATDQTSNHKMAMWPTVLICFLSTVGFLFLDTQAANVALFKPTTANATCGSPAETYYSVVERSKPLRARKLSVCDCCSASNPGVSHNASKMVDGNLTTWWQSPASVDKISITIDLRGNYQKVSACTRVNIRIEILRAQVFRNKQTLCSLQDFCCLFAMWIYVYRKRFIRYRSWGEIQD